MTPVIKTFRPSFKANTKHMFTIQGSFVVDKKYLLPTVVISTDLTAYHWGPVDVLSGSTPTELIVRSMLTKVRPAEHPHRGMGNLTVTVTNNDGAGASQTATVPTVALVADHQVNYDDSPSN